MCRIGSNKYNKSEPFCKLKDRRFIPLRVWPGVVGSHEIFLAGLQSSLYLSYEIEMEKIIIIIVNHEISLFCSIYTYKNLKATHNTYF